MSSVLAGAAGALRVGELRVAYRRAGTGLPLVLLHGALADARAWAPQLVGLADTFTVVAWDAPGCGDSSDPPAPMSMADHGAALAGFLDELALGPAHIVGMSWGSTVALELVRQRPDLVRSLTLAGAYAGWAGSLEPDAVASRLETALDQLATLDPSSVARAWLPTLFSPGVDPVTAAGYLAVMADLRPRPSADALRAMAASDLRAVLPTIRVPTLVLRGDHDVRSDAGVADALLAAIPGARLATIEGAGHVCNVEAPAAFDAAVRGFLHKVGHAVAGHGLGVGSSGGTPAARASGAVQRGGAVPQDPDRDA